MSWLRWRYHTSQRAHASTVSRKKTIRALVALREHWVEPQLPNTFSTVNGLSNIFESVVSSTAFPVAWRVHTMRKCSTVSGVCHVEQFGLVSFLSLLRNFVVKATPRRNLWIIFSIRWGRPDDKFNIKLQVGMQGVEVGVKEIETTPFIRRLTFGLLQKVPMWYPFGSMRLQRL